MLAALIVPAAIMMLVAPALAQDIGFLTPGGREKAAVRVDWGYGGVMRAERASPVVVWVDASEPLAGVVRLTYQQDATQPLVVERAFAATPGRPAPVLVPITLPTSPDEVELEVLDQRGRVVLSRVFGVGGRATEPLPELAYAEQLLIGVVGEERLPEWFRIREERLEGNLARWINEATLIEQTITGSSWQMNERREVSEDDPLDIRVITLDTAIVESWMDLDGLDAIVVRPGAGIPPRVRGAITTWARSGGTLYVLADRAGASWRDWIAPGVDPITLDDPHEHALPGSLREHLLDLQRRETDRNDESPGAASTADISMDGEGQPGEIANVKVPSVHTPASSQVRLRPEDIAGLTPGENVAGRAIRITPDGDRLGWRELDGWRVDDGMLAVEGSLGLGRVVVLGADPARGVRTLSAFGAAAAWEYAFDPVVRERRAFIKEGRDRGLWWKPPSGETEAQRKGIERVVNESIERPPDALAVLVLVGIVLAIMTLGMGPVDMFVLKALRLRHRSWLTAFGWITLASLGAWLIPMMASATDEASSVTRVALVERESPFDVDAARDTAPVSAWRTEILTAFARGPGSFELGAGDRLWRGVSPNQDYGSRRSGRLDPMRLAIIGAGEDREMRPRPVTLGMWGVRSAMSRGIDDAASLATIVRAGVIGGDEVEVAIDIADGWTLEAAAVDGRPAIIEPGATHVIRARLGDASGARMPEWTRGIAQVAERPDEGHKPGRTLELALTRSDEESGVRNVRRVLLRARIVGLEPIATPMDSRETSPEANEAAEEHTP
jgi:hypothetical protein